ncbi:MAG: nucleoside hydrolase [Candidatus Aminicenantes bacterium]|nr:nucleoside hydrolase [Candidatus Aminicenantes bacterium]
MVKVPVIYCTDLFHPYDDPDDHFDIASLYALEELDIRGIVLDQGEKQDSKPGRIPLEQMNCLAERDVSWGIGLSEPLKSPEDAALAEAEKYQKGVRLILDILERAHEPVTIITVGSLRDVAAAFNRRSGLFRERVSRLMIFIGEANAGTREWNVGLDPNAFIRIMNSGLPIWWVPCFDGGNFRNKGNASFWKAGQADLLKYSSDRVINFFIYALLQKDVPDHLGFLEAEVDEREKARILTGKRNLWCAAVFTEAAGRKIIKKEGEWLSISADYPIEEIQACEVFRFIPITLSVDDQTHVIYENTSRSHRIFRFQVVNSKFYPEIMTSVTSHLIGDLGRTRNQGEKEEEKLR